ncbi:hypothetical protein WMF20_11925 [Sorangium sp. So ce834]|uniref:hypothetical protein n=1 Tax=Sorangium sp. So ce834 TaxID=3133321 RepID=UPI003F5E4A7E
MEQLALPVEVVAAREVDGWELGVLSDGTAFMTESGLAAACGVHRRSIGRQATNWEDGSRTGKLADLFERLGITRQKLYISTVMNGTPIKAYPDDVCSAFLEYYAFEADPPTSAAKDLFRKLANASLRMLIYRMAGYEPAAEVPERWRQFHDRLMLNPVPRGYFSVFREMADLTIRMIHAGMVMDYHTIPDGSVGSCWAKHWRKAELASKYGAPIDHPHTYPEYMPQSEANEFVTAKVYPSAALGEFRVWMESEYMPEKFPKYISGKVARGSLPESTATKVLAVFSEARVELPPVSVANAPSKRSA